MGDTKGSTYAAGYVSEEDRMTVLEGLQYVNRNIVQKIINKRLSMLNKSPDIVWVEFDELSKAKLESGDITELYSLGIIDESEVRTRAGFPVKGGGAE
jgi:glycerol-3-phosphate cytidylyltransferase-like family protein